ncbi:MAG: LytTR family DNA-binding domain-containing protein [Bacteroidota bacterium]
MKVTITITTTDEVTDPELQGDDGSEYIVQPEGLEDLAGFLRKVRLNKEPETADRDYIFINVKSKSIKLYLDEVEYIEANGDYIEVKTIYSSYVVHSSLKRMQKKLPDETFMKVHRSYVVNVNRISQVMLDRLQIGRRTIPIGRTNRQIVKSRLKKA